MKKSKDVKSSESLCYRLLVRLNAALVQDIYCTALRSRFYDKSVAEESPYETGKSDQADLIDLEEFILRRKIPKELEGDDNWEYTYVKPSSDENQKMKDTVTQNALIAERAEITENLDLATLTWASDRTSGDLFLTDMIRERRAELMEQLSQNYWDLDPYIRASSLYDRLGVIQRRSY